MPGSEDKQPAGECRILRHPAAGSPPPLHVMPIEAREKSEFCRRSATAHGVAIVALRLLILGYRSEYHRPRDAASRRRADPGHQALREYGRGRRLEPVDSR